MRKTGKKINVTNLNDYKVHYGTVDKNNNTTLYISISTWVKPKLESNIDYSKVIRKLNKKVKDYLFENLNKELFKHKFSIVDLDLRLSGIQFGKSSFMNCEITLFKNTNDKLDSVLMEGEVNEIINGVIDNSLNSHPHFSFNKSKK